MPRRSDGEQTYNSTLFLTSPLDGVGCKRHGPAALPQKETMQPLYKRQGGPQGWYGRVPKTSPTGTRSPGRSPLESGYTDCATPAHHLYIVVSSGLSTKHHLLRRPQKERLLSYWSGTIQKTMITINYVISLLNRCQLRHTAQRDEISGVTYINNSVPYCTSLPLRLRNILLLMTHEIPLRSTTVLAQLLDRVTSQTNPVDKITLNFSLLILILFSHLRPGLLEKYKVYIFPSLYAYLMP